MSAAVLNGDVASRFESLRASRVFPGRNSIYPFEFSKELTMTTHQVIDLIEEGVIGAIRINSANNKSSRSNYRIPVSEYDRFILAGGTTKNGRVKAQGTHAANGKAASR